MLCFHIIGPGLSPGIEIAELYRWPIAHPEEKFRESSVPCDQLGHGADSDSNRLYTIGE